MWKELKVEGGHITLDNAHACGVVMMAQDNIDPSVREDDEPSGHATVYLNAQDAVTLAMLLLMAIKDEVPCSPQS